MSLQVRVLTDAALACALEDVARLRIAVFRDWPYLYDGNLAYERRYLAGYATTPSAVLVGAFDGARLVGVATGMMLLDADASFAGPFAGQPLDPKSVFYCAESVLLPDYRGQGAGHRFFDLREGHARALGATHSTFCAVQRPDDHPRRPDSPRDLAPFWRARGYSPLPEVIARFDWTDIGAQAPTSKPLMFWIRAL